MEITKKLTREQLSIMIDRLEESNFRLEHAISYYRRVKPQEEHTIERLQRKLEDNNELLMNLRGY